MKSLSLYKRTLIFLIIDVLCISLAWLGAFLLRYNLSFSSTAWESYALSILPLVLLVQFLMNWRHSLNRIMSRYVSIQDLIRIIRSVIECSIICLCLFYFTGVTAFIPRSVIPIYALLAIAFLSATRLMVRVVSEWRRGHFSNVKRVLIIGAGRAGEGLIRDLKRSYTSEYDVVCIVDDSTRKIGLQLLDLLLKMGVAVTK